MRVTVRLSAITGDCVSVLTKCPVTVIKTLNMLFAGLVCEKDVKTGQLTGYVGKNCQFSPQEGDSSLYYRTISF